MDPLETVIADVIYVVLMIDELKRWNIMAFKNQYDAFQYIDSEKTYWADTNKNFQGEPLAMTKSFQVFEYNQGNPIRPKKAESASNLLEQNKQLLEMIELMKAQMVKQ